MELVHFANSFQNPNSFCKFTTAFKRSVSTINLWKTVANKGNAHSLETLFFSLAVVSRSRLSQSSRRLFGRFVADQTRPGQYFINDLVDRIHGVLSDDQVFAAWAEKNALGEEDVVKSISDIYRKLCGNEGNNGLKELPNVDNIRCLCGSLLPTDPMIKCEDPRCHVRQHSGCVIIPEEPMEGVSPSSPEVFYCESCRLSRADPFWATVAQPLYPVKLITTSLSVDGSDLLQSVEKSFQLTRADKDLLLQRERQGLLSDAVASKCRPAGTQVIAVNRPASQLLGANDRDDGPIITEFMRDGSNKITLSGCDSRVFCLGVRIVKRRTIQQILNLIPKEVEGEKLEDALARIRLRMQMGIANWRSLLAVVVQSG